MIRTTPFHPRLGELNTQHLWTHWQGHLSALRYTHAMKHEYFAVRNAVGVFDTSPLYKYLLRGRDAERFLAGVLVRDPRTCRPGQAQYTAWCDDRGFLLEDGVVQRHEESWLLTTARPNLGHLADLARRLEVTVEDVSDAYGVLAVQGPRSRQALAGLAPEVERLRWQEHTQVKVGGAEVTLARTGYTGDLGYELTVPADAALDVLDAVLEAGAPHGMRPFGEEALMLLRLEAGLLLVDVEFTSSRLAFTDEERLTPRELGLGWMLRGLDGDRAFVGRDALRREVAQGTSRWSTVGIVVDWEAWDRLHRDAGLLPTKSEHPLPYASVLRDGPDGQGGEQVGVCTTFAYSPVLQRHVGLARVRPHLAAPGTEVHLETTVLHRTTTVPARTARLPLFDPPRRTA